MKNTIKLIFVCSILTFIFSLQAAADQIILDDLIVDGSVCVGPDCANDEDFGFDTLKLKSENPQIRFQDTSSSSSFPSGDWIMGIADSITAPSYFYINDVTAGTTVLKLSSSASGGVALGNGAELEDNSVSVGSAGTERQIKHVAEGIESTDAVNVAQLEQFKTDINAQLEDISNRIDDLVTRLENLETP